MNGTNRPEGRPATTAGDHVTTISDPPATLGGALFLAEIDLRAGARRLEWAAVQRPDLARTARLAFAAAQRCRGDRLAMAS